MTPAQAKKLRVGDAVLTVEDGGHRGEVDAVGRAGVRIVWDDRRVTVLTWGDCAGLERDPGDMPARGGAR